jgi:hypothetical protein
MRYWISSFIDRPGMRRLFVVNFDEGSSRITNPRHRKMVKVLTILKIWGLEYKNSPFACREEGSSRIANPRHHKLRGLISPGEF